MIKISARIIAGGQTQIKARSHTVTVHGYEGNGCENCGRPHSAATCTGYFKAFAPRDINNNLVTLKKQLPRRHSTFIAIGENTEQATNTPQGFTVLLGFITAWD